MITYVKKANADKYSSLYERATEDLMTHSADGLEVEKGSAEAVFSYDYEKDEHGNFILDSQGQKIPIDNTITSLEEYFSWIEELNKINKVYQVLPLDEDVFEIDANTRLISVPASFASNGISVQGDEVSEIVYFKINRYFDNIDLQTRKIFIQWTNANGQDGVSVPNVIDIESEPNYIIFGWPLSSAITSHPGNVSFSVRFYSIDDVTGKISYSLATLTQTATIKPSLDFDLEHLETTGVQVDNVNALLDGRFVDTLTGNNSSTAAEPEYIIDFDDLSDLTNKWEETNVNDVVTQYVSKDLDLDSNGFRTVAFDASAQAISADAGAISYYWKKWNYDTGVQEEIDFATTFVETADKTRTEGKLYYYNSGTEHDPVYKLYNGELDEDTLAGADIDKVFEKRTVSSINTIGRYQVTATNRVRKSKTPKVSYTLVVPRPEDVTITKDLPDRDILAEDKNYVLTLTVNGSVPDQGKVTYQWYRKAPGAENFIAIEDGVNPTLEIQGYGVSGQDDEGNDIIFLVAENGAALGDGYYYCKITNNLNMEYDGDATNVDENGKRRRKMCTISEDTNIIRISHAATAPIVTIDGDDSYTLDEVASSTVALTVVAEIPEASGELVEGWRTDDDTITYQWFRYQSFGSVLADDIEAAAKGEYVVHGDTNLAEYLQKRGATEEEIAATQKPFYDPTEAGYYFCLVTNTYNGTQASQTSRFFSVANA